MDTIVTNEFKEYLYKHIVAPIKKSGGILKDGLDIDEPVEDWDVYIGELKGELEFFNGSLLKFSEFIHIEEKQVEARKEVEFNKENYAYNYLSSERSIIFAYHSKPEKCYKSLKTFPHHKHTGQLKENYTEGNPSITLDKVIDEINNIIL